MKTIVRAVLGALLTAATADPAAAQLGAEANGARADGRWGGELGLGYAFRLAPGFKITPTAGVLVYKGDNDRYYEDSNGGSPRCRDSTNGQYAASEDCDNTAVRAYGRVEATYSIPLSVTFGAGVRVGDDVRPYGTLAVPIGSGFEVKGNAGPHYFAAGLRVGF